MRIRFAPMSWLLAGALMASATVASAHATVASGPAFAGGRALVTFGVGHGCAGADTVSVDVQIPAEITAVRGVPNVFGPADVRVNDAELPTNVVWTKDDARDVDDQFYQVAIRIGVPNTPFTSLHFRITQVCRDADGVESVAEWTALPGEPTEGETLGPAAELVILPARTPGWNKYTVAAQISDLAKYFRDAQIVWADDKAFSPNAAIADIIDSDAQAEPLTEIAAGTEIWVKY